MIDWDKELEKIFEDPLLADVTASKKRPTSSDRLVASFQAVLDFYEQNHRLPREDMAEERQLFNNLKGILSSPSRIERCRPFDDYGLLPSDQSTAEEPQVEYHTEGPDSTEEVTVELSPEEQLEAILNDPLFADIEAGKDLGLFDVPDYMRERLKARKEADYIGKRKPCEDFNQYEAGFEEINDGLKTGKYHLIKFSQEYLTVGRYFIEDGIIGYLAAFEEEKKDRFGVKDGRTRVIYENGSEADIKYKTITKNLSVTGYSIQDCSDVTTEELEQHFTLTDKDVESGTIYVLRSRSARPEIAAIKDLYKIGFTVTSVESRIANAKKEPTYLCADVEVVATWKVYNVKSSTFEALIHKLFASVQLQVTVDGHRPKEWFIVPFPIIEQAILCIIKGESVEYNPQLQQLIYLTNPTKTMKCLSVQQPWAYLICSGIKDVENRSWRPKQAPGRILIHAGAKLDRYAQGEAEDIVGHELPPLTSSAIIGYVDVYGFIQNSDNKWADVGHVAEWKWLLRNAKLFKQPIPAKGRLGLYDVNIDSDNLPETL